MAATLTKPGRPRSAEADQAIREATLSLLASEGYAELTMYGVAAAAGVSTATLYRRWSSKLELVIEVLRERAGVPEVHDTGSLYGDVRAVVRGMVEALQGTTTDDSVLPGLISEISRNPELARVFRSSLVTPRRATWKQLLERAHARGELRNDIDFDLVTDLITGPIYARRLVTGAPVNAAMARDLADLVFHAIASRKALKAAT